MFDTIEKIGNLEYFLNADGKKVYRYADDTIGYRSAELLPEVEQYLNRARALHNYPTRPMIDNLIAMQSESKRKAVNYVRYRLLGECSYMDVYGGDIEAGKELHDATETITQLQEDIRELTFMVKLILQKIEEKT